MIHLRNQLITPGQQLICIIRSTVLLHPVQPSGPVGITSQGVGVAYHNQPPAQQQFNIDACQACSDRCILPHVSPVQWPYLRGLERATFMRRGSDTKPSLLSVRTAENITTSASRPCMVTVL